MRSLRHALQTGACIALMSSPAFANAVDQKGETQVVAEPPAFMRVAESDANVLSLELAIRDFERTADGPRIALVGVTHIGDGRYYKQLEKQLDEFDLVLYESVTPPGTGGAGGETIEEQQRTTRAAMEYVGSIVEAAIIETGQPPKSLDDAREFIATADPRLAGAFDHARLDAWGRDLAYTVTTDAAGVSTYTLRSLGADGKPGGEASDADFGLAVPPAALPIAQMQEDNIQAELARALGLSFQLTAMDYDKDNWILSDMSLDELQAALRARNAEWDVLGGTMSGTSLTGKIASIFLRLIQVADAFFDGAVSDMVKVLLIEMLADEALVNQSMDQLGEGFGKVLIDDRNQVVMDDLKDIMDKHPDAESIAIFYGAGHMADLAERLNDQLDYVPSNEQWLPAISVDMANSAMDKRQLMQMRMMMKRMMKMQMR